MAEEAFYTPRKDTVGGGDLRRTREEILVRTIKTRTPNDQSGRDFNFKTPVQSEKGPETHGKLKKPRLGLSRSRVHLPALKTSKMYQSTPAIPTNYLPNTPKSDRRSVSIESHLNVFDADASETPSGITSVPLSDNDRTGDNAMPAMTSRSQTLPIIREEKRNSKPETENWVLEDDLKIAERRFNFSRYQLSIAVPDEDPMVSIDKRMAELRHMAKPRRQYCSLLQNLHPDKRSWILVS